MLNKFSGGLKKLSVGLDKFSIKFIGAILLVILVAVFHRLIWIYGMYTGDGGFAPVLQEESKKVDYVLVTSGLCKLQMSCAANFYSWESRRNGALFVLYGVTDEKAIEEIALALSKTFFETRSMDFFRIEVYPLKKAASNNGQEYNQDSLMTYTFERE